MIIMIKYILEKQKENIQSFIDNTVEEIVEKLVHESEDVQEIRLLRKHLHFVEEINSILKQETVSAVNRYQD